MSEQKRYEYDAVIRADPDGSGAYVPFPWDIRQEFVRGRIKVRERFDGVPYDGGIVNMGVRHPDGTVCYAIGVLKSIRETLRKGDGDTVHVLIEKRD